MPKRPPCQREACQIQACLEKNGYDSARCEKEIELMRRCCQRIHYKSFICDGYNPELTDKNRERKSPP